jgi:hypothetical protein
VASVAANLASWRAMDAVRRAVVDGRLATHDGDGEEATDGDGLRAQAMSARAPYPTLFQINTRVRLCWTSCRTTRRPTTAG